MGGGGLKLGVGHSVLIIITKIIRMGLNSTSVQHATQFLEICTIESTSNFFFVTLAKSERELTSMTSQCKPKNIDQQLLAIGKQLYLWKLAL